jgi:hypothetical protein
MIAPQAIQRPEPRTRKTTAHQATTDTTVQQHTLAAGQEPQVVFTTELTRLQRKILRLLEMPGAYNR